MKISLDFGITITDCLSLDGKDLKHRSISSKEIPSKNLIKNIFNDIDFNNEIDLIAVTGGMHGNIGNQLDGIEVVHVNEVQAVGEGAMKLSNVSKSTTSIILSAGSGTACILAKEGDAKADAAKQLADLALLSQGMLKGAKLTQFISRSVELMK
jgi:hypothetical protein